MTKQQQTWEITLITPLHTGDGELLRPDMDFMVSKKGKGLEVIDLEAVLESLKDNPKALSDMGRMDISSFIRSYGLLSVRPAYTLHWPGKAPAEIRRFLKDAYGRPYLAGSSLKGAIRTALWQGLDRTKLPSASSDFRGFEKAVSRMDGEPHNDFLRPLQISDSPGIAPDGALQVDDIRFFNLQTGDRAGWKDFSSRRTLDRFQEASGSYVESLKSQTRLYVRAKLDPFLPSAHMKKLWPIPQGRGLDSFPSLAGEVNRHSKRIAEREKEFFTRYGQNHLAAFYTDVINGIQSMEKMPGAFIVRMAWGSGWRGMTGDWLNDRELDAVRRERRLGKPGVAVFPKTRRLAMKDGMPSLPLGWVLVRPVADELFFRAAESLSVPDIPAPEIKEEVPAPKPVPKPEPETVQTEIWEGAFVKYTPNNRKITATWEKKKAETDQKEVIPENYHKKLFEQKKALTLKVEVEVYGNAYRIVKVL